MARSRVEQKTWTFGTCSFAATSPPLEALQPTTRLNVLVPFEEALKLNLAIEECLRRLNSYKRSTSRGKRAALNLTLHLQVGRIAVNEGSIGKT